MKLPPIYLEVKPKKFIFQAELIFLFMLANKSLNTFFEENFESSSMPYLLYKDKKLLEEKNYKAFAKEQIKKTGKIYFSILLALFYGFFYGAINFVEYGAEGNNWDLGIGIMALVFMIVITFFSTKEYYSVKSSMEFFIKLIEENEKETGSVKTI